MDAPPQSPAFDPYAYRSSQVPSTRGNVERPLPIHDDEDDEVVPETQNLGDDDEEDEYNVDEDAGNEEDEAREKKGKTVSEKWTKEQEETLAKAWDRTRASGCKDLDVMKVALKEFKERFPSGFQHIEAWEVVRRHEKWAQVPLMGEEGEGSAPKRKSVDVDFSIPDMNEDPSPQRAQRRDKRQATSSEGSSAELAAQFKVYTAMKEAKQAVELEAIELRKKRESEARELISAQLETMKNYNFDRDMKIFLKPHDDVPPSMLPIILARKREIANKYGWPCDF
ncbi:hypothetical protein HanXRQr2_Chr09g0414351 [Helianthus annuus]|uniref:No apical meristem-associated C-terminal domain-containing protein n=1 Tax=Helianthus annuus TaxID=4232 RepID=A0A9K3NAK5_HELAN|nr:hypothetical protein HanXRQr2_Chr09g0414351 [Helianthus annuus]KAJ0895429.1 hypothetical protein HanPSC8_Chr09g0400491 [Helianthus annuus]